MKTTNDPAASTPSHARLAAIRLLVTPRIARASAASPSEMRRPRAETPTDVAGSVSSGAPVSPHWTATTPSVPAATSTQPTAAIASRSSTGRRATATATNAAPINATYPRYRIHRARIPGGDPDSLTPAAVPAGAADGGATP